MALKVNETAIVDFTESGRSSQSTKLSCKEDYDDDITNTEETDIPEPIQSKEKCVTHSFQNVLDTKLDLKRDQYKIPIQVFPVPCVMVFVILLIITAVVTIGVSGITKLTLDCSIEYPSPMRLKFTSMDFSVDTDTGLTKAKEYFHEVSTAYDEEKNLWFKKGVLIGQWSCPEQRRNCIDLNNKLLAASSVETDFYFEVCSKLFVGIDPELSLLDDCYRTDRVTWNLHTCIQGSIDVWSKVKKPVLIVDISRFYPKHWYYNSSLSPTQLQGNYIDYTHDDFYYCGAFRTVNDLDIVVREGQSVSLNVFSVQGDVDIGTRTLHPCGSKAVSVLTDTLEEFLECQVDSECIIVESEDECKEAAKSRYTEWKNVVPKCIIPGDNSNELLCCNVLQEVELNTDRIVSTADVNTLKNYFKNPEKSDAFNQFEWLPLQLFPRLVEDPKFINWIVNGTDHGHRSFLADIDVSATSIINPVQLIIHNRYASHLFGGQKLIAMTYEPLSRTGDQYMSTTLLFISSILSVAGLSIFAKIFVMLYVKYKKSDGWFESIQEDILKIDQLAKQIDKSEIKESTSYNTSSSVSSSIEGYTYHH